MQTRFTWLVNTVKPVIGSMVFLIMLQFLEACKKKTLRGEIIPGICTGANANCPSFQNFNLIMNPSGNAPLTGIITITANQPIKLSYTVQGQDGEDFSFSNDKISTGNDTSINLFGLYPGFANTVTVSIQNKEGFIVQKIITVPANALPADIPHPNEIMVNSRKAGITSKFVMLFPNKFRALSASLGANTIAIDSYGKVRWYLTSPLLKGKTTVPLKNGNWLVLLTNAFVEFDLMGTILKNVPIAMRSHHDVCQATNGDLIYLGESNLNNTIEDKVYRVNCNTGALIDSINIYNILDPLRPQLPAGQANDWLHCNSIEHDAVDNSIIISARHQSAVFKIDLATKKLKWILADSTGWNSSLKPYLFKPTGPAFEQCWGQHSAILKPGDNNTLLVFDNGNVRSYTNPVAPMANYSRCVEYSINAGSKTVAQNFEFGKSYGSALFAPYISNVQYLSNDHMLVNFGGIYKDINNNAIDLNNPNGRNQVRIFEIDKQQNVYFDISIKNPNTSEPQLIGFMSYRAYSFSFK